MVSLDLCTSEAVSFDLWTDATPSQNENSEPLDNLQLPTLTQVDVIYGSRTSLYTRNGSFPL